MALTSFVASSPYSPPPNSLPIPSFTITSNVLLILASIIFFLISVFTVLALTIRSAWLNRSFAPPPPPLRKKSLKSLPIVNVNHDFNISEESECQICLMSFTQGDKIRVLPQCAHVFHAKCVDTWLMSRSSCPSCRHVIIPIEPSTGKGEDDVAVNGCAQPPPCCLSHCLFLV
ncbi:hypothetical protein LUZ60_011994 [Juncus effusus]|nr:hypothetical protein LUZ60_011994 [Juncus effusus]